MSILSLIVRGFVSIYFIYTDIVILKQFSENEYSFINSVMIFLIFVLLSCSIYDIIHVYKNGPYVNSMETLMQYHNFLECVLFRNIDSFHFQTKKGYYIYYPKMTKKSYNTDLVIKNRFEDIVYYVALESEMCTKKTKNEHVKYFFRDYEKGLETIFG